MTIAPWHPTPHAKHPKLLDDIHADVVVVGGGIAGVTTALCLAQEGKTVVLLDALAIGAGETSRTTAHLASALDDGIDELERLHGETGAELAVQSHAAAIDFIEDMVLTHTIDCGFERVPGYLFAGRSGHTRDLDRELLAARRIGMKGVELLARAPLAGFDTGPCLRFQQQAQIDPLRYLDALVKLFIEAGGQVYEHSHVDHVEYGARAVVRVDHGGSVTAGHVVIATNAPIVGTKTLPLLEYAYRSYAIALEVPRAVAPRGLFWDTEDPYHYVRAHHVDESLSHLIVGGEDHKVGQDPEHGTERHARLEAWTRERFPYAGHVAFAWSGQILEPADGLAFIGRFGAAGHNTYVASGDSGHGMTHGTIAGMLIRDLVAGRRNTWADLYDPHRKTLSALGHVASENLNTISQYTRWLTKGEATDVYDIKPGEGRIVREGLHKLAVCRDDDGGMHCVSATCTHLGGIVVWNGAEKTWDCPCHGSRFDVDGAVLNGPAQTPLEHRLLPRKRRAG